MEQMAMQGSIDILRTDPPELSPLRKRAFDEYLLLCFAMADLHGKSRVPGGRTFDWDWPTSTLRLGFIAITVAPCMGSSGELRCFYLKVKAKITAEHHVALTVVPVIRGDDFMWAALGQVFSSSALIGEFMRRSY